MLYSYEYPRPALTADCIITDETKTQILLIERKNDPFKYHWALPGGFMEMTESLFETAFRELEEETGVLVQKLEFFCIADGVNRDPRGRTVSAVFYGSFNRDSKIKAGDDAARVDWFDLKQLPPLAFDHKEIINRFSAEVLIS